jgi:hypothetical protein
VRGLFLLFKRGGGGGGEEEEEEETGADLLQQTCSIDTRCFFFCSIDTLFFFFFWVSFSPMWVMIAAGCFSKASVER